MWMIIILFIILIGFTGNMVSILRNIQQSNEKIIKLLEENQTHK
ncbi:hypothetical protein M2369_002897 [Bacillus sp. JUb11]|uniref:Uncharacterized protein n=1 Tax=Bacillus altitudinis TaxID=293387 RepID=A0A653PB99_BACAB|nr:hypothetical protein [Bacillus sp. JUb11]GJI59159.1 hypothetical protein BATMR_21870 [Bacillus altitudinis]SIT85150.1 hypothetical protein SAMN05216491_1738 [Bacillus altitudinis]VXB26983.1 conserved hypothetical protein [Bacillus altitudinis]